MREQSRPLSALVVDDDEPDRREVADLFAGEGFSVTEARTGREALEYLERGNYNAIVLDVLMPVVDGFEVMRFLRSNNPSVLVRTVVISRVDMRDLSRFFPGARVLQKPAPVEELRKIAKEIREGEEKRQQQGDGRPV